MVGGWESRPRTLATTLVRERGGGWKEIAEGVEVRAAGGWRAQSGSVGIATRCRPLARTPGPDSNWVTSPRTTVANLFAPSGAHRGQLRATEHADLTRHRFSLSLSLSLSLFLSFSLCLYSSPSFSSRSAVFARDSFATRRVHARRWTWCLWRRISNGGDFETRIDEGPGRVDGEETRRLWMRPACGGTGLGRFHVKNSRGQERERWCKGKSVSSSSDDLVWDSEANGGSNRRSGQGRPGILGQSLTQLRY